MRPRDELQLVSECEGADSSSGNDALQSSPGWQRVLGSTGGDVPTDHLILGSSLWLGQVETVLEVGSPVQTPLC